MDESNRESVRGGSLSVGAILRMKNDLGSTAACILRNTANRAKYDSVPL